MRRLFAWALCGMVLTCAGTAARSADALPTSHAATQPRVVVVFQPEGGCQEVETLRVCEAFAKALEPTGVAGRIVAPTIRDDVAGFLSLLARQNYWLIITHGYQYAPELAQVARRYPDTRFVVLDASRTDVKGAPRNVQGVLFRTSEAAYLAGWLAGSLERRRPGPDVVGVVGGLKIPAVDEFVVGFRAGVKRASPRARVLVDYSDDFLDTSKCTALARRQVARGAGTLFNVAGKCGLGTMRVAADSGIWAVGVDSDQSFLGPHVLTSVLKRVDTAFATLLEQVMSHRIVVGRDTVLTLRDRAVGLGKISPKVPPSLVRQLDRLSERIEAGEIVVPTTVPRRRGG